MALQSKINGFSAWINVRLYAFDCQVNNILTEIFQGTNMKHLLESFTGKSVKRLQSLDGLTQLQILTRVEWFVAEMKKHGIIDEKAHMDCQSIALKNVDHVLKFLWKLIEHDIWFTWESSCQLQDTDADVVCSVPFQWTLEVKPTEKEKLPAPGSSSLMASLEELENPPSPLSSLHPHTETQPSELKDFQPFPGHELSKKYNTKIPKGGWNCYPSAEKCIIDLINELLKMSCKTKKLKVKTLHDLMDSWVMCSMVNAFLPNTFTLEVLLNDRWTVNIALKTLEDLLRVSTSFSSDDLVKAEPQAICAYACFIFMAGYKYKQSRTVAESMKSLHLEMEEITFRLKTFSSETLDSHQSAEKNNLHQRLMKVENELSWFKKSYDVEFCEKWVRHGRKVQKHTKKILLQKVQERFELVAVPRNVTVANLCCSMGINLSLSPGYGFYQITNKETLASDQKIMIQDRQTEKFLEDFSGLRSNVNIRKLLNLPKDVIEIDPNAYGKFKILLESQSKKLLLKENSLFLYPVFPGGTSHWHHQLLQAVKDTDYSTVENLVMFFKDACPSLINQKEPSSGNGALHLACQTGCFSTVRLLLENGALLEQHNERIRTPFYFATVGQHRAVCQLLIEWGCDINAKDFRSQSALDVLLNKDLKDYCIEYSVFWANTVPLIVEGKRDVLQSVVQQHASGHQAMASLRSRCIDGSSLLHAAAYYGETDLIKALLQMQVPVDLLDYKGATPLQRSRDSNTMQLLLFHGADLNWTDADGNTALHMVCYGEPGAASCLDCLQLLLSRKASRRKWNKKGLLPIHCSAMQGRIDVAQALMDFDAQPKTNKAEISDKMDTPSLLYLSTVNSHLKCANWLISKAFTFKPGEQEELMFNVLLDEMKVEDQVQILNFLLKNGVNINALNEKGKSVLHLTALDLDLYDILAALLDCGADVNIEDDECRTPLFYSVFASNLHGAQLLIEHGANVRHQDSHSLTAFGYIHGYDEWLESGLFSEGINQLLQSYDLHRCTSFVRDMTRKIKEKEMSERFSSIRSRLDGLTFRKSTYREMPQAVSK